MSWSAFLIVLMGLVILALVSKIALIYRALSQIQFEFGTKLTTDTNTLISVSSGDCRIRQFAAALNQELIKLRSIRWRFQSGDLEIKEAITNITHDLRTPLTAIVGYLDLLEEEDTSEIVARSLAVIRNRTNALKQLTEELFSYSLLITQNQELKKEKVCLNNVLEESLASHYRAFLDRGIEPVIEISDVNIVRFADLAALTRVFENILSNALKYSTGDLRVSLSDSGEMIFSNTAPSLDFVQVERLFNRFFTLEATRNSSGLGLAIAKVLVEQMGGEIKARYEVDRLHVSIVFPTHY